jgi:glycosyltransferase involved in cell wall biosynthesis
VAADTSSAEGRPQQSHPHQPRPDRSPIPAVDITLPVHNEELIIEASVERLHQHLTEHFPYSWQITIVENGSTDSTRLLGQRLASELREVRFISMRQAGRGGALRRVWSESGSEVLAYMDVDLSTDLSALTALVAPLVSDDADVAIGSRLSPESLVRRSPTREVLSRGYMALLRAAFRPPFHDAQCGFKALRADAAGVLLPLVQDNGWFFDTELLLLACHMNLRLHEVPVEWVEDADSRVRIIKTVWQDLEGVARMHRRLRSGAVVPVRPATNGHVTEHAA